MDFTVPEMSELLRSIEDHDLLTPYGFEQTTVFDMIKLSNGFGPDRWAPWLRHTANMFLHPLIEISVIHDWEWGTEQNDGTLAAYHESNSRFQENGRILVRSKFAWWRVVERVRWNLRVDAMWEMLETPIARDIWLDGYEKRTGKTAPGREVLNHV